MATDVLERIYRLIVDGNEAERQLRKISANTKQVDDSLKGMATSVKTAFAGLGAGIVVQQVVSNFKAIVDAMDEAVKTSQKLGISIDALQRWQFALNLSGVEMGTFATAVGKVAQGITDIDAGKITDQTKALRALGITGKETAEEGLALLVEQFSRLEDGPRKTALAMEVFGKAGKELIPLLNAGAKGMHEMNAEFAAFRAGFSDEDAKRAERFNDNLTKIATAIKGVGVALVVDFLPALEKASARLVENIKTFGVWGGLWEQYWQNVKGVYTDSLLSLDQLKAKQKQLLDAGGLANVKDAQALQPQIDALEKVQRAAADAAREQQRFASQRSKNAQDEIAQRQALLVAKEREAALDKYLLELSGKAVAIGDGRKAGLGVLQKELGKAQTESIDRTLALIDAERKRAESAVTTADILGTKLLPFERQLTQARQESLAAESQVLKDSEAWALAKRQEAASTEFLYQSLTSTNEALREYARVTLEAREASNVHTKTLEKQKTELQVLEEGYQSFFTNLSTGVADFEDVFKRAAQSIIAELLKIWAKKYIIDAIMAMFGSSNQPFYGGGGIAAPFAVMPTVGAQSGVGVSALATTDMTATTSSLAPLSRSPSAPVSGGVEVHVHNNAGAAIDVQTSDDGKRIDVIVERTRRALANDVRSGGTLFSGALESTYALGRGRA